jgi:hypothetical protein
MAPLWDALAHVYEVLGFAAAAAGDEVFRQLVLARIIEPTSKLDSARVLEEVGGLDPPSYRTLLRRLPVYAQESWRQQIAAACAARVGLAPASLVLYDVSTLYFETDAGAPGRADRQERHREVRRLGARDTRRPRAGAVPAAAVPAVTAVTAVTRAPGPPPPRRLDHLDAHITYSPATTAPTTTANESTTWARPAALRGGARPVHATPPLPATQHGVLPGRVRRGPPDDGRACGQSADNLRTKLRGRTLVDQVSSL